MKTTQFKIAAVLATIIIALPLCASAAQGGTLVAPFTGTAASATASVPISGTFNITSFSNNNGQLVANGTLNFALNGVQQIIQTSAAVTDPSGSCPILNLTIGPINLNLLGLVIQTNQIALAITAQSGPGNLLGNLLCDVANLLNGTGGLSGLATGLLNQVVTLLNQILTQL